jgi:hypothetical protein
VKITTTDPQPAAAAVAELIPWDECICEGRRKPRPNCWATEHDLAPAERFDRAEGEGRR